MTTPRQIDHGSLPASGPFLSLIDALDADLRLDAFQSLARGGFVGPRSIQAWTAECSAAAATPATSTTCWRR